MNSEMTIYQHHMKSALSIARYGLGRTAPNPTVGCVIVKDGHVVGRGRTAEGGRPHAETQALEMAGDKARDATAYLTLEPCSHTGQTPPCAQALIEAGIAKVFIAIEDTDGRVSGRGTQMLRDAGIEVEVGLARDEAYDVNKGFFLTRSDNRPLISLKLATSSNGKIAGENKKQIWITNELSRRRTHLIRAQHDAIAVGVNTVLIDNPSLTTRLDGVEHRAKIVVFDRGKRLSGNEKIFENDPIVITNPNLSEAMADLIAQGITRLMVEGGAGMVSAFLKAGLYDQFYWFKASHDIDENGLDAIEHFDIADIEVGTDLKLSNTVQLDSDVLRVYNSPLPNFS